MTEGQQVEEFDELVEVQSDKATVPITSRYAGKIVKIHYDLEDTALVGKPLVDIEVEDADDEPIDHYESGMAPLRHKVQRSYDETFPFPIHSNHDFSRTRRSKETNGQESRKIIRRKR